MFTFSGGDRIMSLPKKILIATACSCLVGSTVIALPFTNLFNYSAQAQSRKVRYVPPTNLDAPIVSASGITRSAGCTTACLIALVPDLQSEATPVPQTISERLTIYFLTPKIRGLAYFRLYDGDSSVSERKPIYQTSFSINNEAGLIAFKMPDDAPILEIGKRYTWDFKVTPSYRPRMGISEEPKIVSGTMRRILPPKKLVARLSKTSLSSDRAALFAQESIWFETIQILAEAKLTVPKNTEIFDEWTALLKSANLDRVLPFSFVGQK